MKAKELRTKSFEELKQLLDEKRRELQDIRFRHAGGKLSDFRELRTVRRTIAKALTILREQQKV